MRLSEAIRKGSVGKHQIIGQLFDDGGGVCAMGAAEEAVGGGYRSFELPSALLPGQPCPECGAEVGTDGLGEFRIDRLRMNVVHLNNDHRWTFEQIADWVQLQEAIHGIGQEQPVEQPELVTA